MGSQPYGNSVRITSQSFQHFPNWWQWEWGYLYFPMATLLQKIWTGLPLDQATSKHELHGPMGDSYVCKEVQVGKAVQFIHLGMFSSICDYSHPTGVHLGVPCSPPMKGVPIYLGLFSPIRSCSHLFGVVLIHQG